MGTRTTSARRAVSNGSGRTRSASWRWIPPTDGCRDTSPGYLYLQGRSTMHGYASRKDDLRSRLRKVEGQARGLPRMVDEDQYCIDILPQVNSGTAALRAVGMGLLDDHVRHCVADSIAAGDGDVKGGGLGAAGSRLVV